MKLEDYVKELAVKYEDFVCRDLGLTRAQVNSPMFFPEFQHTPIIRMVADPYTPEQALELEQRSPYALMLYSDLAGEITMETFEELKKISVPPYRQNWNQKDAWTLKNLVNETMKEMNIDTRGTVLWEVEKERDTDLIVVRYMREESDCFRTLAERGHVHVENSPFPLWTARLLLAHFDAAKERGELFINFLRNIDPQKAVSK